MHNAQCTVRNVHCALCIEHSTLIILFDVDGVLVHSRAYHLALQKTVAYFSRRMGAGEITLTQHDIDVFESQSITVEWDSGAICIAAVLLERLWAAPPEKWPPEFWAALDELGAQAVRVARPDFAALARRLGAATPPGQRSAHIALETFKRDCAGQKWTAFANPVLDHLLLHCYEIAFAPAMQVFQNYVIGHEQYEACYGLPARMQCESLLETADRPLLKPEMRDQVRAAREAGRVHIALYTARPSLAPVEAGNGLRGYTPEAEAALKLVGLAGIPITAFGKLDWVGQRIGRSGSELIKPSPVQAMAAIAAARTGLEAEALEAAVAVERGDHLRHPLTACRGETVHVFEDSASSLRAATRAVELLNQRGLDLTLVRHGIAPEGSPKREALAPIADHVHADVNEGLKQIL
jgi:hypothetical protein